MGKTWKDHPQAKMERHPHHFIHRQSNTVLVQNREVRQRLQDEYQG